MSWGQYILAVIISFPITLIGYSAFPVIFAKVRKAPITKKKYRRLCYGINLAVILGFAIFGGVSLRPYLLWTWLFTKRGIKILRSRVVLEDDESYYNASVDESVPGLSVVKTDENHFCRKCGEKLLENSKFCRKCGAQIEEL